MWLNIHRNLTKIDEWEQQLRNKIRQTATDTREELLTVVSEHRNKVTKDLTSLSRELNNGLLIAIFLVVSYPNPRL